MNESEGTCSDVAGLSSQSHYPVKEEGYFVFPYKHALFMGSSNDLTNCLSSP